MNLQEYTDNLPENIRLKNRIAMLEESLKLAIFDAEAAERAKTEFEKRLYHDIRTPIIGIVKAARMMQEKNADAALQKLSTELSDACEELLSFFNNVLNAVHIAAGDCPRFTWKFSIRETLENIVKLTQPTATLKRLWFQYSVDEAIPEFLVGDPFRMHRVILELIVNALKFTETGSVHVFVNLLKEKNHGKDLLLEITVEDTGIGIPSDRQAQLFTRFNRLGFSYPTLGRSAGLGLFITKQFVNDMQGKIYYDAEHHQHNPGSRFICLIPVRRAVLHTYISPKGTHYRVWNSEELRDSSEPCFQNDLTDCL